MVLIFTCFSQFQIFCVSRYKVETLLDLHYDTFLPKWTELDYSDTEDSDSSKQCATGSEASSVIWQNESSEASDPDVTNTG